MQKVRKLEDEVKEIEANDNSYELIKGVINLVKRDPDVVPNEGGLLLETEFTTRSAETLGGEAMAKADRQKTIVKFRIQITAIYKFVVSIDKGLNLLDISDKYIINYRLCFKGVKKGEQKGIGS